MHNVVISGTGLYTPANSISNEELVQSFNTYVQQFNAEHAAAIDGDGLHPLLGEPVGRNGHAAAHKRTGSHPSRSRRPPRIHDIQSPAA